MTVPATLSWWYRAMTASLVLAATITRASAAKCVIDPTIPTRISDVAPQDMLCAGYLDPSKPPYNAASDGKSDATSALQQSLDDAYAYRMAVLLPAGSIFLISRQLRAVQDGRPPAMRKYGYQLIGAGGGARPLLRLVDNSTVANGTLLYVCVGWEAVAVVRHTGCFAKASSSFMTAVFPITTTTAPHLVLQVFCVD